MANTELVNFEALALEDDMSRRNDLARNVATLFSFTSETCSDEQIETYDHVLVRLADMVEAQARAFIADRGQGVIYRRNVWHAGLRVLAAPAEFVVVMALSDKDDDVLLDLETELLIEGGANREDERI